jgi:hypothetical protein
MSKKRPRTLREIEADPRVVEVWTEDDGWNENGRPAYWASLNEGYNWENCHQLHECTVADLADALSCVVRCDDPEHLCECQYK